MRGGNTQNDKKKKNRFAIVTAVEYCKIAKLSEMG